MLQVLFVTFYCFTGYDISLWMYYYTLGEYYSSQLARYIKSIPW